MDILHMGLLVCLLAGAAATYLGGLQSFVGAPIIGMLFGILLTNIGPATFVNATKKGAGFSSKYLLKAGIILAGGTLSFKSIVGVGLSAVPIIVFNICLSFAVALLIGRLMKVGGKTCTLVGGGTAICGGTAIATLTPIVEADEEEMAYAMTAIFLFDIFAAIMWPYAARALGLSAEQYGVLGGLAISDTSSVTAAGATFDAIMGAAASATVNGEVLTGGSMAVIVKLTRTVMLVFVAVAVMLAKNLRSKGENAVNNDGQSLAKRVLKAFPLFVLGFLLMAVVNTFVDFSSISLGSWKLSTIFSKSYKYFITVALVGVGYKIKIADLFKKGARPVLLGGCTWLAVATSTLIYVLAIM